MTKKYPVTYGLIAINVVVFAAMMWYDRTLSYATLVDFGAKVNYRIVDGYLWHLVTPIFLHGSILHLGFNSMALYFVGPLVERFYGPKKYLIFYLLIGTIGNIGSFISSNTVSLGASGAIFGLFAFHIYLFILNREGYKKIFGSQMFTVIALNLVYTFTNPAIDKAGHIFGFVGGLAIYFLFDQFSRHPERLRQLAFAFLIILSIGAGFKYRMYKYSEDYFIDKFSYYYYKGDQEAAWEVEQEYLEYHGEDN